MSALLLLALCVVAVPCLLLVVLVGLYWWYPRPIILLGIRYLAYLKYGLKRKFLRTNNFTFCYYERKPVVGGSQTPPTLLLLHGYNSDKSLWISTVSHLPTDWGMLVLDLPGHGESSFKPKEDYSAIGFADKVHKFTEAHRLDKVHLAGISLGAAVAGTFAALYPSKLHSVTIMCMPGLHRLPGGQATPFMEQLEVERQDCRLLLPRTAEDITEMIRNGQYNAEKNMPHYRLRKAFLEIMMTCYPALKEIMADVFQTDVVGHLNSMSAKITTPTQILWGNQDKVCHPAGAKVLGSMIKDAKVVQLDRCGHAIMLDRPRKLARLISQFVLEKHT